MRARAFTKRVEVWQTSSVPDGFGGFSLSSTKIADSWAKVETLQPGKSKNATAFGIVDANNSVMFTLNKRNDINYNLGDMFIVYRGVKYTISTAPTDINFTGNTIVFIGAATSQKGNQISGPELILNGDFSNGLADWNNPSSHWQAVNDAAYYPTSTDVFPLAQDPATEPQKTYQLGFQLNMVEGTMEVAYEDENSLLVITDFFNTGFHQMTITNPRYNTPLIFGGKSLVQTEFTMDNVTLKEILN